MDPVCAPTTLPVPGATRTATSGFANFRWLEDDGRLRFHHDPGTRYGYSGEGFYIAQLVLEEALGLDVGHEMQTRVFDRFGMTRTGMQWRPDFRENLADGFRVDGTPEPHDERSSVSAAGSMDTSIEDQARLWAGIVRGDGLTPASRAEMVRPQTPITSRHQLPTLIRGTNSANAEIGLAAGLGLVTFRDPRGEVWFKGRLDLRKTVLQIRLTARPSTRPNAPMKLAVVFTPWRLLSDSLSR